MKQLLAAIGIVLCYFSANAYAEKPVFVSNEFPPYTMIKDGQPAGIHVDIVLEFCKRNGIEPNIRIVPWARALAEVKEGDAAGIFPAVKNEERTAFLWFPSEQLGSDKNVIMTLKGKGAKISSLDDLKNKTVGVVRGYSYSPEFDNYKEMVKDESADDLMMIRKLGEGRTAFAVGEEGNLKFISMQIGIQLETAYLLLEDPNYFAFSKASGDDGKMLAEKFDQTIRQLRKEGVVDKIIAKYLGTDE